MNMNKKGDNEVRTTQDLPFFGLISSFSIFPSICQPTPAIFSYTATSRMSKLAVQNVRESSCLGPLAS